MYTCLYELARRMLSDKPEEYETIESFIIPVLKELDWPLCRSYRQKSVLRKYLVITL